MKYSDELIKYYLSEPIPEGECRYVMYWSFKDTCLDPETNEEIVEKFRQHLKTVGWDYKVGFEVYKDPHEPDDVNRAIIYIYNEDMELLTEGGLSLVANSKA